MLKQTLAVVLCAALVTTGCATSSSGAGPRMAQAPPAPVQNTGILADYVQRLPTGSRVRVERTDGTSFRGTLMKTTPQAILVQKNTRVPETPVEVAVDQLARVTLDQGGTSVGKTIAIGVGSGVAATFGFLLILFALAGD
jgi:hypothetical protein